MSGFSPSRAQIALALIVLQSKPSELSIADYISRIRSAIARRKRKVPVDSQHYIDGTLFWKKAYEKSETENSRLLDRIFDLEQTIERNKNISSESQIASKRIIDVSGTSKANIQTKRRKIEQTTTEKSVEDHNNCQLSINIPEHHSLLRAFYALGTNLQNHKSTLQTKCQSIKALSAAMEQSLQFIFENTTFCQMVAFKIEEFLGIAIKSWAALLNALRKVTELESDLYLECVPMLVHFFQILLGRIQQICLDKADKHIKDNRKRKTKGKTSTEIKTCAISLIASTDSATEPWQKICVTITKLCFQILSMLDCSDKAQLLVFEGMLCALLYHIGSSLSLLVFAQSGVSLENQQGLLSPRGLLDVAHIDSETALLTSQLAAPYFTLILQQAIKITSSLSDDQRSNLLKQSSPGTESHVGLAGKLRKKLQNTLLQGIYGDEDAAFANSLNQPAEPDPVEVERLLKSLEQADDSSEWFIGQVWENIGWDILASEDGGQNT